MNAFLLIDKPAGWTSFDCCAVVRKALGTKRVGHTGTLDPFATGLLVIAVGKCTKLIPYLEKDRKIYRTKIVFNKTSETLDPESDIIISEAPVVIRAEAVERVLKEEFTGKITQVPPKYSALKIDGKRAYELARQGQEVEMKSRETEIFNIHIAEVGDHWCELEIEVAAGFYVRSFARDLAVALGTTGMCSALRRVGVGDILTGDWQSPAQLKAGEIEPKLIDPREILTDLAVVEIPKDRLPDWSHGRAVKLENTSTGEVLVTCNDKTIGLGLLGQGSLQPKIVF